MLFLQEKSDQQVFLFSFKRQFFPEFRMGNADQFLRPLGHGLAAQFGYAVFRYDVVDIVLARRNDSARCQGRHDFADRIILSCRREGNEALAAFRGNGAAYIICLAARTGNMTGSGRFRADLAKEIDFDGGVDGNEVGMLGDDGRIVDVVDGQHEEHRVVIDEIIDPLGAEGQGRYGFAPVEGFLHIRHGATFDKLYHAVRKELRVDA